jgi:hypothetical protein
LVGHAAGLRDAREIADKDSFRSGHGNQRFLAALFVTGMQNRAVPLLYE